MNFYKVTLRLNSPFASEWQADTIWGHLCWGLRFSHGEDALANFIARYGSGEPPLLVSNGFPGDFLPRPVLPRKPAADRADYAKRKANKNTRWLTIEEFIEALNGRDVAPSERPEEIQIITLKNLINRRTDTTASPEGQDAAGRLFSFRQHYLDMVSIYLKVTDDFIGTAKELFQNLAKSGYGKRKTVGYGQFAVQSFDAFAGFAPTAAPNGFVSLSNFVPAATNPTKGFWDILVKYGKLGEEYAISGNPHKQPLVMFRAGSCFYDQSGHDYYGRLVTGLSGRYPEAVQYGYALPVPIRLPTP
jgi:CRISPR-associated protein Csm4